MGSSADETKSHGFMWYVGLFQASCFSLVYFVAPFYILSCLVIFVMTGVAAVNKVETSFSLYWVLAYVSPMLLSTIVPPIAMPTVLSLLKPMTYYFDSFEMIHERENWYEELVEKQSANYMLACQPHGVLSYVGIMSAVVAPPAVQGKLPTAVADAVLHTPILKHVMGIFGLISASKKSLIKTMTKNKGVQGTVVLYVGGLAELFLSDENEERLYLKNRKGFIKLSLQTGVDIVPIYMFGNTTVLSVMKHGLLSSLSRKLGASLTYMWGKWYLPIPRNDCKLLYVSGKPVGIPHIPEPTQADIDKYHALYCDQVQRLFEKYKEKVPEYKHKKLHIM